MTDAITNIAESCTLFDIATIVGTAKFSPCEKYRYLLTREWSDGPNVTFLMFNPSTATAETDDATIRRCIGFAKLWGYGRLSILNLFAYRSTDPKAIGKMNMVEAEGIENPSWVIKTAQQSVEIVCAWGCAQHVRGIDARITSEMALIVTHAPWATLQCLGYRKDGHPRHPLMLAYDTPREPFVWKG